MMIRKIDLVNIVLDPLPFAIQYIEKAELNSKQLARITGIPASTIRSYVNGTRTKIGSDHVEKIYKFIFEREGLI